MFGAARLFFGSPIGMGFLILLAAVIGGGYLAHVIQVNMLEKTINDERDKNTALAKKITALETDKAKLQGQVTELTSANKACAESVDKQNAAIKSIMDGQAANEARWRGAVNAANRNAADANKLIEQILNGKPTGGESWCAFWEKQVRGYLVRRQGK